MKKVSKRLNTEHVNAMVKALRSVKVFDIVRGKGTVVVTHKKAGEVLRGLKAGKADLWLVSHADDLFA